MHPSGPTFEAESTLMNPDTTPTNPDTTKAKLDATHVDAARVDFAYLSTALPEPLRQAVSQFPDQAVSQRGNEDGTTRLGDELLRFSRLGHRTKGILHKGEFGAEFSALMLLFPLRHMGPLRVTDLAEVKQADPSTISRQVTQLVKAGLARREADQVDGRASRLAITDAGMDACRRMHEARNALLSEALGDWPAEQIATFADLFREFNSCLEALMRGEAAATSRENA
jgi:DNA-binding MarR family transcriptional regulator